MSHERMFVAALRLDPQDSTTWLAYADWLEERGDPRARFIRIIEELKNLREEDPGFLSLRAEKERLRPQIDPRWQAMIGLQWSTPHNAEVQNCDLFAFRCAKQWNELRATECADVRFCEECQSHVHYCFSTDEAGEQAKRGRCVALEQQDIELGGFFAPAGIVAEDVQIGHDNL